MSARIVNLANALVTSINAASLLPVGATAVRKFVATVKPDDVDTMLVYVLPGQREIDFATRDQMQHDDEVVVAFFVRAPSVVEQEAAMAVFEDVFDHIAENCRELASEFVLVGMEWLASYDAQLLDQGPGIVKTLMKITYRSLA